MSQCVWMLVQILGVGTEAHRRMKNNVKGEGLRQEAGNSSPG